MLMGGLFNCGWITSPPFLSCRVAGCLQVGVRYIHVVDALAPVKALLLIHDQRAKYLVENVSHYSPALGLTKSCSVSI